MKIDATDARVSAIAATQTQLKSYGEQQTKQVSHDNKSNTDTSKSNPNDKITIQLDVSKSTLETLKKVGSVSELLVKTAQNIRKTDESLSAGATIVAQMKESLGKIVKQYPPFPPDDRNRMEILMSYSGLQKQISSLMIPPPPPPVYEKVQHLWENLFSNQASLQTPQLPANVPDSHIKVANDQLANLQNQIGLVQEALGNSIKGI